MTSTSSCSSDLNPARVLFIFVFEELPKMFKRVRDSSINVGISSDAEVTLDEASTHDNLEVLNQGCPCIKCDEVFKTKDELDIHVRNIHEKFNCNVCAFSAASVSSVENHKNLSHELPVDDQQNKSVNDTDDMPVVIIEEANINCEKCDFKSTNKSDVENHMKDSHKETKKNKAPNKKNKAAVDKSKSNCLKCKQVIGNKHKLDCSVCKIPTHITCLNSIENERKEEFKTGKRSFQCSECKKERLGVKKVTNCNNINKCDVCDFSSTEVAELIRHVNEAHLNPRNTGKFTCEVCAVELDDESLLNAHIQDNHEYNKCSLCDVETTTTEAMEGHMKIHENLVDEIIKSMEKHFQSKCDEMEEKLKLEILANQKLKEENSAIECKMKGMKKEMDKEKENRKKVENLLSAKEKELKDASDLVKKEIEKNEVKQREIERLENEVKKKSEEIASMNINSGDNNHAKIKELNDDLDLAKELCSEYEETIANLEKEKNEAVNDVLKSKIKLEEELRSTTLEKQRLKDTEDC